MRKAKVLDAIDKAMDNYNPRAEEEKVVGYYSGVVDGLNKVYQYIAENGSYDMIG